MVEFTDKERTALNFVLSVDMDALGLDRKFHAAIRSAKKKLAKVEPVPEPTKDDEQELRWYAAARDSGWAPGDEDSPQEFCEVELGEDSDVLKDVDVESWREEYNWWKAKP